MIETEEVEATAKTEEGITTVAEEGGGMTETEEGLEATIGAEEGVTTETEEVVAMDVVGPECGERPKVPGVEQSIWPGSMARRRTE